MVSCMKISVVYGLRLPSKGRIQYLAITLIDAQRAMSTMIAARVASTHSRGPQPANMLGSAGTPVSGMTDPARLVGVELGKVVGVAVAWRLSENAVDVALGTAVGVAVACGPAEVAVAVGVRVAA